MIVARARRSSWLWAAAATLAVIAGARGFAQQSSSAPQRPTFRATADLIQIDVVVVGADGLAVRGLKKDDFEILDRGTPKDVAAFEEIRHERPPELELPPTMKLDVADNSTARSDRLIVLVLDDLHFQGKTQSVKDMARQVVERLGGAASLALVTTSGKFGVEPTEDRALLLAQIDAFIDKFDPEGKRLVAGAEAPPVPRLPVMGTGVPNAQPTPSADPGNLGRFFGDMTQYKTLEDVAKKIGMDDGRRKAFVWISGGNGDHALPCGQVDPRVNQGMSYYNMAECGLLEAMRKSNVAGYAIATGDFDSSVLSTVADATGGFVVNSSTFDRDLDHLIEDLDHYYLLGFYTADEKDRSYHPIEVRVKRPGVTVRYRKGYQPGSVPAPPKNKTDLAQMAANVLPNTELPLRLFAAPAPRHGQQDAGVEITLEVRADRARLAEADGNFRDVLRYEVWAVDLARKKVTKSVAREARLELGARDLVPGPDGAATYQVHTSLPLPPGRYQLRASAKSTKLDKAGSVYLETEMPDFKARALEIGGIALGYATGLARLGGGMIQDETSTGRFKPSLDRNFSRADTIRVVCEVSNSGKAAAQVVVELLDPEGHVVKGIDESTIDAAPTSQVDVTASLRSLSPGGYRLRVSAASGTLTAQRAVGIIVR